MRSIIMLMLVITLRAYCQQPPPIEWQRAYGGSWQDIGWSITQLQNGGYLAVGYSSSSDGDASENNGETNYWVLRIDNTGDLLWPLSLGGTSEDFGFCGIQTNNGGFLVGGRATSTGGDVVGSHGGGEAWLVEINEQAELQWQRPMGGSSDEQWMNLRPTNDGGVVAIGRTYSNDGDILMNHGDWDVWVCHMDAEDSIEWTATYGGSDLDYGEDIQQTNEGGYILTGYATSEDGDLIGNTGNGEGWLVKLNELGVIEWQRDYGANNMDWLRAVAPISDGGYVAVGQSNSNDGDFSENHGGTDAWVIRTDAYGEPIWQRVFGGAGEDFACSVITELDGGFLICGRTGSNDGDVSGNNGGFDAWIFRLDANGELLWQLPLGGSDFDLANQLSRTADGGFVMLGQVSSFNAGVPGYHDSRDYWLVKFAAAPTLMPAFAEPVAEIHVSTSHEVLISLPSEHGTAQVVVTDGQGRCVRTVSFSGERCKLDLGNLAPGSYVMHLCSANRCSGYRLLLL